MSTEEQQEEPGEFDEYEEEQPNGFVKFIEYLQTPQGDGRLAQAIDIYKQNSQRQLDALKVNAVALRATQLILIVSVIAAATFLSIEDKMTPTVSLLFGTVVGYFFGRK